MNFIKQALRVVISSAIGLPLMYHLDLKGFVLILFFFGIYIVVSLLIEAIWMQATKMSTNNKKQKQKRKN
jgi:hypothetical protein